MTIMAYIARTKTPNNHSGNGSKNTAAGTILASIGKIIINQNKVMVWGLDLCQISGSVNDWPMAMLGKAKAMRDPKYPANKAIAEKKTIVTTLTPPLTEPVGDMIKKSEVVTNTITVIAIMTATIDSI